MRAKIGNPEAVTATAHKLARIIYHLITTGQAYDETVFAQQQTRYRKHQEAKLHSRARELGFQLVPLADTTTYEEACKSSIFNSSVV